MGRVPFLFFLFIAISAYADINCDSLKAIPTTESECLKCPNRSYGIATISKMWQHKEELVCYLNNCPDGYFFDSRYKNCHPCDYDQGGTCLYVSEEECAKCPNRKMNSYKYTKQCELPFECPKDRPIMHSWGGFEDSCGSGCKSCSEAGDSFKAEDCSICPGYVKNETGLCVLERTMLSSLKEFGEFRTKDWYLSSCDELWGMETIKSECDRCSNRVYKDGICMLKKCPNEDDIRLLSGDCRKKEYAQEWDYFMSTEEECKKVENHVWHNNFCVLKKDNHFFNDNYEQLISCEALDAYDMDPFWCQSCPNRISLEDPMGRGYMCALKECPMDFSLRSMDYDCYQCNSPQTVYATKEKCLECPNRKWKDNNCSWNEKCIQGSMLVDIYSKQEHKPDDGTVLIGPPHVHYKCVSCQDPAGYKTYEDECAKCSNRKMEDGYCILK